MHHTVVHVAYNLPSSSIASTEAKQERGVNLESLIRRDNFFLLPMRNRDVAG